MIPKLLINKTKSMTFQEKVQSMSAKQIIMAMVDALTHPPIINVDMGSFGYSRIVEERKFFGLIRRKKEVCFGCAATNTICQISGIVLTPDNINSRSLRAKALGSERIFLQQFENAIDDLRVGFVDGYNSYAESIGVATIKPVEGLELKRLLSDYTNKDLKPYKRLAEAQE